MSRQSASGKWTKDLKYKPGEERCRCCNVLLVPGLAKDNPKANIAPSKMAKANYQCRACAAADRRRLREERKEFDKMEKQIRADVAAVRVSPTPEPTPAGNPNRRQPLSSSFKQLSPGTKQLTHAQLNRKRKAAPGEP